MNYINIMLNEKNVEGPTFKWKLWDHYEIYSKTLLRLIYRDHKHLKSSISEYLQFFLLVSIMTARR